MSITNKLFSLLKIAFVAFVNVSCRHNWLYYTPKLEHTTPMYTWGMEVMKCVTKAMKTHHYYILRWLWWLCDSNICVKNVHCLHMHIMDLTSVLDRDSARSCHRYEVPSVTKLYLTLNPRQSVGRERVSRELSLVPPHRNSLVFSQDQSKRLFLWHCFFSDRYLQSPGSTALIAPMETSHMSC